MPPDTLPVITVQHYEGPSHARFTEHSPLLDEEAQTDLTSLTDEKSRGILGYWRQLLSVSGPATAFVAIVHTLPAVILGTLVNALDGVSCTSCFSFPEVIPFVLRVHVDGMLIFPAAGVFAGLEGVGVSMFFVS